MFDATPWMRGYAALRCFELNTQNACTAQERVLDDLVSRAASTKFGRDHNFQSIKSVADYQQRVALRRYDDFFRQYWQQDFPTLIDCSWPGLIPYFALSSGTATGRSKYIPCSHDTLLANARGAHDILAHHVMARPWSNVLGGKSLLLGGSTALKTEAPGVASGDLSGIEACEVPWWESDWVFPPKHLALVSDWEEKIDRLAHAALDEDIRAISGAPNWLLLFFERLFALRPGASCLANIFPNLELIIHGGINFAPYRERFRELLEGSHAETRETYVASEGFFAVADGSDGGGLRLQLDGGVFFEFVPVSALDCAQPERLWIGSVATGVEYAIVVTTCSGLWSYLLGDTVRFVSLSPHRILVTGRTNYVLSAVGEHVISQEIDDAVCTASSAAGIAVTDYSAGYVQSREGGAIPHHLYIVEVSSPLMEARCLSEFALRIDECLTKSNDDYASHRARNFGLKPPEVIAVPPGTFAAWMKSRGKLGGQNKVPRIIADEALFSGLRAFVTANLAAS